MGFEREDGDLFSPMGAGSSADWGTASPDTREPAGLHEASWAPNYPNPGRGRIAPKGMPGSPTEWKGGEGPPRPRGSSGEHRIQKDQVHSTSGRGAIPDIANGVWRDHENDPRPPDISTEGRSSH